MACWLAVVRKTDGGDKDGSRETSQKAVVLSAGSYSGDGNKAIALRFVLEIETSFADGIRCVGKSSF